MPGLRRDDPILSLTREIAQIRGELRRHIAGVPLFDLSHQNTPAQIVANQNDYVIGNYDILRISSNAARTITGLAGGLRGRYIRLFNIGAFTITLSNQDVLSAVTNRFSFYGTQNIQLGAGSSILLYYDDIQGRWINAQTNMLERGSWTPTYSCSGAMTYTPVTTTFAFYARIGSLVAFHVRATGTTVAPANTTIFISAPFTMYNPGANMACVATAIDVGNFVARGYLKPADSTIAVVRTDFTTGDINWGIGAGRIVIAEGVYFCQD